MSWARSMRATVFVGAALGVALLAPNVAGVGVAGFDLLRGHPEYRVYGELMPDEPAWSAALEKDHGVVVHRVAGCNIAGPVRAFTDAYDWTIRRFVPGIDAR
jgi:hypothetical protein